MKLVIHQHFTRMTKIMHQQRSRWEPLHQHGHFPYSVTIATKIFQTLYRGNTQCSCYVKIQELWRSFPVSLMTERR